MSHTKGPWAVYADAITGDPFNRMRYEVAATGETICRIYSSSYEGGPTNAFSNARLVAAAPELLAALEGLLADASGRHKHCGHDFACVCASDMARAAIAKAKGIDTKSPD